MSIGYDITWINAEGYDLSDRCDPQGVRVPGLAVRAPPSSVDGYAAQKSGAETALTEPQNRKWLSAETYLSHFYFFLTWLCDLADETPLI